MLWKVKCVGVCVHACVCVCESVDTRPIARVGLAYLCVDE
jgi:hypothetical protein